MQDIDKNNNDTPVSTVNTESDLSYKFLTSALSSAFMILKVIMTVLIVLFLTSGVFTVGPDEQALVLRFGKVIGGENKLRGPGLNWALPAPITEVIRIPVTKKQNLVIENCWYAETDAEKLGTRKSRVRPNDPLNPLKDGYCLTRNDSVLTGSEADYNIVHAKWMLQYTIASPEKFFRNIYYETPKPGEDFLDVMALSVNPLLETLAADAIVTEMVNYSIDQAIVNTPAIAMSIKKRLQLKLDQISSGINVDAMQVVGKITWPRQVDMAFQASSNAVMEKDKLVFEAKGYADTLMSETGGINADDVLTKLKAPNLDEQEKQFLLSQLSGQSQENIALARAYKTKVVSSAKANAEYLHSLLPEYKKRPKLVMQEIYQDAIKEVMTNADEKIFLQPSASDKTTQLRVLINRDPNIKKPKKK